MTGNLPPLIHPAPLAQKMRLRFHLIVLGMSAASLAVGLYHWARHVQDRAWLADRAKRVVALSGATTPRERAIALRDHLREAVRIEGAEHDNRPFLRNTARATIESGLGYCGESTRALLALAKEVGVDGQRVNLYGDHLNHVVAELEVEPGRLVLVDAQNSPEVNAYFDERDRTVDDVIAGPEALFRDYSNINLRRVPILGAFVKRVRTHQNWITDMAEEPSLILCFVCTAVGVALPTTLLMDRVLMRIYARRFGAQVLTASVKKGGPAASGPTMTEIESDPPRAPSGHPA